MVLASASPRRKELLAQIGLEPEIRPSRMEEETSEKKPDMVVMELSRQKAEDVASGCPEGTMVIGADTVAVSYTHLDVYKRQVYMGLPRESLPITRTA